MKISFVVMITLILVSGFNAYDAVKKYSQEEFEIITHGDIPIPTTMKEIEVVTDEDVPIEIEVSERFNLAGIEIIDDVTTVIYENLENNYLHGNEQLTVYNIKSSPVRYYVNIKDDEVKSISAYIKRLEDFYKYLEKDFMIGKSEEEMLHSIMSSANIDPASQSQIMQEFKHTIENPEKDKSLYDYTFNTYHAETKHAAGIKIDIML
ncbi:hypothetical protein AN639_12290 [Candidatus Epulonipiscium fishelsonii]|nr:hypothetical protein AN639_12290 [Epulopiscium sp. SCG-B05WGA-EpuloA1]